MTVDKLALLEQELSAIYRNVPGILFYIAVEPDGEFRFLSVSDAWLVATGLTQEQVVGSLVRDIIPAPSRDMVLNRYREAILTGHTVRWEEVSEYPAGQWYGEVAVTPVYDASGVATHLIGIVHDITERNRLDESHRENEARQSFLLKLSDSLRPLANPAEIQLTAANLLGERLQVNRISYADVEGTDLIVRLSYANGVAPYIGRALISVGAGLLAECRRGNFVTVNDVRTDPRLTDSERANLLGNEIRAFTVAMLLKAGQWMSAFCVESVTPRQWAHTEIELIRDVAERTWEAVERALAEEVLRGSEQRLRLALHATGGGSWTWEAHTNHLDWDDRFRAQFGFTSDQQPTFEAWLACVHEEDRQQVLGLLEEILYTNKRDTWDNTYRIVRPNGVLWMQSLGRADRDAKGQVARLTGLELDITEHRRAEEAVREREHRLRLALDASAAGVWTWDARTNEIDWDDRVRAQFGFNPGEPVTFEKWISRLHEEDRPRLLDRHSNMLHNPHDDEWNMIFRVVRPDGTEAWIQGLGRSTHDTDGRIMRITGISLDITERRRAEEALRASEHKFRLSLRAGRLGTWEYQLNTGVFVADAACTTMRGFAPDEVIATLEQANRHVHPDDVAEFQRRFEQAVAERGTFEYEYRVVRSTGETRWIASLGIIQPGTSSLFGIVQDITARKQAELELQDRHSQQERTLRLLLETAVQGILSVDAGGFIVMANAATEAMFGWGRGELIGQSVEQLLPPALPEGHAVERAAYLEAYTQAMGIGSNLVGQRKDGSTFPIEISLSHVAAADGGHAIAFVTDVSARKQAEEALRRSHAVLEERTAELEQRTHQLSRLASQLTLAEQNAREQLARTLHDGLQQLLFSARMTIDRAVKGNSQADQVGLLQRASADVNEAMEAARTLSVNLFPPVLQLGGLPAALTWLAKRTKEQYGVVVNVTTDSRANPEASDVRILLFEAVRELLFNAVKHAHVDRVGIILEVVPDDVIHIHVTDEGVGFDSAVTLDHKNQQQVGLGLFSIRERLALLGGHLDIQSSPGKGSRFSLTLPRSNLPRLAPGGAGVRRHAQSWQGRLVYDSAAGTSKPLRILIADDHVVARAGLRELFSERPGLRVVGEAANGMEAISKAKALQPDVIVMDVSMLHMNGIEATRTICSSLPQIQIVGLSTHDDENSERSMREAGAVAYFTKNEGADRLLDYLLSLHPQAKGSARS